MKKRRHASRFLLAAAVVALTIGVAQAGADTAGSTTSVRKATAKYHSLATAKHDGYAVLKDKNGISCIAMDDVPAMGAMGVHYAAGTNVADGKIKATDPEAIVYAPTANGLKLAALEYVVLKSAWDAHHRTPPALFGHGFDVTPAGNRYGLPAFYSLHAWLWKTNPSGEFSMWNPAVSCHGKRG